MTMTVRNILTNYNDNNGRGPKPIELPGCASGRQIIETIEISNHYADSGLVNIDVGGIRVTVKAAELKAAVDNARNAVWDVV
jgi:hypothetical protein